MKHRAIVAFDLGTRLGWARQNAQGELDSGYHDLLNKADHKQPLSTRTATRFLNWRDFLGTQLREPTDLVVYEEVAMLRGMAATQIYAGMIAILLLACEDAKIPYAGVPVATIKKHITGKGNAKKEDMINAVNAKFGDERITDHNEADAIALLDYADHNLRDGV